MRKTSALLIVGMIAVLLALAWGGLAFFQKQSALEEEKKNENIIGQLKVEVTQLENEKVLEAISAKKTAEKVSEEAIFWSEIIDDIQNAIPEDSKGEDVAVITSYSGARGSLNFSVETIPGSDDPYLDVADFIESFNESEYFMDSFVPGISSGVDERGEEVLSFSMTTTYVAEDFDLPEVSSQEEESQPVAR